MTGNKIQYMYQYPPCKTLVIINDRGEACGHVFSEHLLTILVHGVRF